MRMFKKEEGFTLVELMVVVLIIGILVAVAIPVFNAASATARQRACQANLRTLDGAVEQWKAALATNDPAGWTGLGDAETPLAPYVKDWDGSTVCPAGGSYTTSITVIANAPDLCTFRCPNGHAYTTN
jgi:type IV pilus assembly protein PilA